jgi:putative FmdB family regulatory protein
MPIYEFHCTTCRKNFDELYRSASERRHPKCPACGSSDVHKKFSSFALGGKSGSAGGDSGGGCGGCSRSSCSGCH